MKKQFSHSLNYSRGRGSNGIAALAWSVGTIIVLGILFILLRMFAPGAVIAIATPFWKGGSSFEAGVGNVFSGFGNASKLASENTALQSQVSELENENAVLTARAQDLTKLLGGQSEIGSAGILAGVLARPPESPYDTVIVGMGAKDGVVANATTFATGGIPIGTVESTTAHSATIKLLSTPNLTTNGWVGENRIPLTLNGTGAGTFTATLPKAAPVAVGDSVYVPGPGAVPIGTIARIDSDPSSPTVVLYIQPLVNIFSLTWVEISD
jgi:cell shape-determining protein MreC